MPFYGGAVESGPEVRCARRLKFAGLAHGDALEKMEQKDRYDYDMTMSNALEERKKRKRDLLEETLTV